MAVKQLDNWLADRTGPTRGEEGSVELVYLGDGDACIYLYFVPQSLQTFLALANLVNKET